MRQRINALWWQLMIVAVVGLVFSAPQSAVAGCCKCGYGIDGGEDDEGDGECSIKKATGTCQKSCPIVFENDVEILYDEDTGDLVIEVGTDEKCMPGDNAKCTQYCEDNKPEDEELQDICDKAGECAMDIADPWVGGDDETSGPSTPEPEYPGQDYPNPPVTVCPNCRY